MPESNMELVEREATEHGWTVEKRSGWLWVFTRGNTVAWLAWGDISTPYQTCTYAAISVDGSAGRVPANPRLRIVQVRQWLTAVGEK